MRLVTLLTFVLIPAIASGQSERPAGIITDALRGLSTVDLVVEAFGELPDPKQASQVLRTPLEARLALNGIKAEYDPSKVATAPRLHLTAYVVRSEDFKQFAYDVRLSLSRMVQMPVPSENRTADIRATVWHKSLLSLAPPGKTEKMRDAIEELTRAFVNDFLAANPKSR